MTELRQRMGPLSLLRPVYRSLLSTGRSYAAFDEERVLPLLRGLVSQGGDGEVLDPMSGYGRLMSFCSRLGIPAFCLEPCPPLHLWQVLVHPANADMFTGIAREMLKAQHRWPKTGMKAAVSDDWFPAESKRVIEGLLRLTQSVLERRVGSELDSEKLVLAFLLPFVGRLSAWVPGDVVTRTKRGGICVYLGWEDDLRAYLCCLLDQLARVRSEAESDSHTIELGDCRTFAFERRRFGFMVTSPPYPNREDISSMFEPESSCLGWLSDSGLIGAWRAQQPAIGTCRVRGRKDAVVRSQSANGFLRKLEKFEGNKRARQAIRGYYIPYLTNYFADLEQAYENVATSLRQDFTGYVIVVNNTARDQVIPMHEFMVETWQSMGFEVMVESSSESFHVGTKNPRARGFKAKHTEYTIKVSRT